MAEQPRTVVLPEAHRKPGVEHCTGPNCGAAIYWLHFETPEGKAAPINAERGEKGNVLVDFQQLTYRVVGKAVAGGYTAHHATCPDVARFKGRGKK